MKQKQIGIIAVLFSAMMWALEPLYAKLSYYESTFLQTSVIRAYIVVLIALFYILLIKKKSLLKINRKQFSVLIYIAIIGTLLADLIYFYALLTTPTLNAVLIGHLQPMFIIIFAILFLKSEKLHLKNYIGIGFMILSAIFVSTKTISNALSFTFGSIGDILVLCATIAWATTALVMRKYIVDIHSATITFYRFFIASIIFTFFIPIINIKYITMNQILVGIIVGVGTICYYEGLKRLKAAKVSAIELAAPVFAAVIGFFILNEPITGIQIIGIICLFIGVFLITSYKPNLKFIKKKTCLHYKTENKESLKVYTKNKIR